MWNKEILLHLFLRASAPTGTSLGIRTLKILLANCRYLLSVLFLTTFGIEAEAIQGVEKRTRA